MSPASTAPPLPATRPTFAHQMREYAATVGVLVSLNDKEPVAQLVESLTDSLTREVRKRPHPLVYINLGVLVPAVFALGMLYQRFSDLESRVTQMRSTETLAVKVDNIQSQLDSQRAEFQELTRRLNQLLDRRRLQDDR